MFKFHALVEKLYLSDPKECLAVLIGSVLKEVTHEQRLAIEENITNYLHSLDLKEQ